MKTNTPKTLLEAVRCFSDLAVCHEYMTLIKWPDGKVTCPKCGGDHIGHITSRRMFQCKDKNCRKQFSVKVGTIFEDSPLGLDKWFVGVWCIVNAKNGISSHEIGRALGITQKSAWHMLHRIRLAMQTKTFNKIRGPVETDETLIGGKVMNMHRSKKRKGGGSLGKAIVHGLLERGGEVRCNVVPRQTRKILQQEVRKNVEPGAVLYSDGLSSYRGLDAEFIHSVIDHATSYVNGLVHVNGIENFWSLLKRTIKGTYVSVDPPHLFRYLDEQTWRFNKRKGNDASRFLEAMLNIVGKRLTFAELTGASAPA